jgi:hypothetical protein
MFNGIIRYSLNTSIRALKRDDNGDFCRYRDYAALEARVKELAADNAALREQRARMTLKANAFEAELERLKAQDPIGRIDRGEANDSNEYPDVRVVCLHEQADWINFQDGTELFLRPSPAAAVSVKVPEDEDGNPAGFIAWYELKFAYAPFKGTGHVADCESAYRAGIEAAGEEVKS